MQSHSASCTAGGVAFPALAAFVGVLSALQASMNSGLGTASGGAIYGALACYVIGCFIMILLVSFLALFGRQFGVLTGANPLVHMPNGYPTVLELCGGVCGALFMITAVHVAPALGTALLFTLLVVGQLGASVLADHRGWGKTKAPLHAGKVACVALALLGVVISGATSVMDSDAIGSEEDDDGSGPGQDPGTTYTSGQQLGLAVAAMVAGAMQPTQALLNWKLSQRLPHWLLAVTVSFTVSCTITFIAACIVLQVRHDTSSDVWSRMQGATPGAWAGAPFQLMVLAGGVLLPPRITTAMYYTLYIGGELTCSLVLDALGAFGLPMRPVTAGRVVGIGFVAAGAAGLQRHEAVHRALLACATRLNVRLPHSLNPAFLSLDHPSPTNAIHGDDIHGREEEAGAGMGTGIGIGGAYGHLEEDRQVGIVKGHAKGVGLLIHTPHDGYSDVADESTPLRSSGHTPGHGGGGAVGGRSFLANLAPRLASGEASASSVSAEADPLLGTS